MQDQAYAAELGLMKNPELAEEAGKYGLNFNKNVTRPNRIKRILKAREKQQAEQGPPPPEETQTVGPAEYQQTTFEQLASKPSDGETGEPKKEKRGGFRPGSGRKPGQTAEVVTWQKLPKHPHPAIKEGLQTLFKAWAATVKEQAVELTEEEAVNLALPYTQWMHVLGYGDKIPPWATLAITTVWTTVNITMAKYAIAKRAKPDMFMWIRKAFGKLKRRKPDQGTTHGATSDHPADIREEGQRQDQPGTNGNGQV